MKKFFDNVYVQILTIILLLCITVGGPIFVGVKGFQFLSVGKPILITLLDFLFLLWSYLVGYVMFIVYARELSQNSKKSKRNLGCLIKIISTIVLLSYFNVFVVWLNVLMPLLLINQIFIAYLYITLSIISLISLIIGIIIFIKEVL